MFDWPIQYSLLASKRSNIRLWSFSLTVCHSISGTVLECNDYYGRKFSGVFSVCESMRCDRVHPFPKINLEGKTTWTALEFIDIGQLIDIALIFTYTGYIYILVTCPPTYLLGIIKLCVCEYVQRSLHPALPCTNEYLYGVMTNRIGLYSVFIGHCMRILKVKQTWPHDVTRVVY